MAKYITYIIHTECIGCKKHLGVKTSPTPPIKLGHKSHGVCPACIRKQREKRLTAASLPLQAV